MRIGGVPPTIDDRWVMIFLFIFLIGRLLLSERIKIWRWLLPKNSKGRAEPGSKWCLIAEDLYVYAVIDKEYKSVKTSLYESLRLPTNIEGLFKAGVLSSSTMSAIREIWAVKLREWTLRRQQNPLIGQAQSGKRIKSNKNPLKEFQMRHRIGGGMALSPMKKTAMEILSQDWSRFPLNRRWKDVHTTLFASCDYSLETGYKPPAHENEPRIRCAVTVIARYAKTPKSW